MRKLNKLLAVVLLVSISMFSACTEKEVPVPTVNTERLDDLRNELRDLRLQVYGEQWEVEDTSTENASLEAQIASIEAEIERLKAIYERSVVMGLHVIDFQNNKLSNATVKLAQNGEVFTGTTDSNGYVEFTNVRSGMVSGVVEMEGYTTANFTSRLVESGTSDDIEVIRFAKIALFPRQDNVEKTGMFLLKGYVFANFSALDDYSGNQGQNPSNPYWMYNPAGEKKLRFSLTLNNIVSWSSAFINIQSVIYEGIQYETTTGSDGYYEVYLPTRGIFFDAQNYYYQNFGFLVQAEEFVADYTYIQASDEITEKRLFSVDLHHDCYYYDLSPGSFPGDTRVANFFYHSSKY